MKLLFNLLFVKFLFSYLYWNLSNSLQKSPRAACSLLPDLLPLLRRPAYKKCTQQNGKAGHMFKCRSCAENKPGRDWGQHWALVHTPKPRDASPSLPSSPPYTPHQSIPMLLPTPGNPSWELLQQKGSQELSWHMHTAQNRSAGATTLKLWFLCLWIFKAATWVCAHSFSAYVSWARSSHAVVSSHEQPVSCIKALCKEGSSPSPERTWGTSAWAPSIAQTASWLHLQSPTVKPKYGSCYSHPRTVGKSGLGVYFFQLRDMAQPEPRVDAAAALTAETQIPFCDCGIHANRPWKRPFRVSKIYLKKASSARRRRQVTTRQLPHINIIKTLRASVCRAAFFRQSENNVYYEFFLNGFLYGVSRQQHEKKNPLIFFS